MSIYSSGRRRRKLLRSHLGERSTHSSSCSEIEQSSDDCQLSLLLPPLSLAGHLKLSAYEDSSALVVKSEWRSRA